MPLNFLDLGGSDTVTSLKPLEKMKLTNLDLGRCSKIQDFEVLENMPLAALDLSACLQLRDLVFLQKLKTLKSLTITGVDKVEDLTPLAGLDLQNNALTPRFIHKGMDVLRNMKSLEAIAVDGDRRIEPAQFWKLYDMGEFKSEQILAMR